MLTDNRNTSGNTHKKLFWQGLPGHTFFLLPIIAALSGCLDQNPKALVDNYSAIDIYERNYNVSVLDNSKENEEIKYGYEVFQSTPKYLGQNNGKEAMAYAGNNLSCNNCHLWAGTKPYAAPLIGVIQRFPQFRGRENKIGTIEERINGCMERSMNGNMLPPENKEMKAMVAYLNWLSRFAPDDGKDQRAGIC